MGVRICVYSILVGKPENKMPLGRPRSKLENNIKICIQEIGRWLGLD
jgi:hypothetical protein